MIKNAPNPLFAVKNHSMERRAFWHDYSQPGTYLITLTVNERRPLLGRLSPDTPAVALSPLGEAIRDNELQKISHFYANIEVWRYVIMPDHIHMILRVKAPFADGKRLGHAIGGFKNGCNKVYHSICGTEKPPLFTPKYNDKILHNYIQLNRWKNYILDNPRRLFIKRRNPEFFTVKRNKAICDETMEIVGNEFLLDIPDKTAVIVHRRDSDAEFKRLWQQCRECGENGGVIVSAAIAPREKLIMRDMMDRGYRIILIRENGFPELYKPSGEAFNACSRGVLLQISPWEYHMQKAAITRAQCLRLNDIALKIASM